MDDVVGITDLPSASPFKPSVNNPGAKPSAEVQASPETRPSFVTPWGGCVWGSNALRKHLPLTALPFCFLPQVKALQPGAARHVARQISALLIPSVVLMVLLATNSTLSRNPHPLRVWLRSQDLRQGRPDTTPTFEISTGFSLGPSLFRKQTLLTPHIPGCFPHVQAPHAAFSRHASRQASALWI